MNERQYDVCRVTRGGVTFTAINVSRDEALLNMAVVLAAYGANWQLQPENPRGLIRVCNTHTEEYHIVVMMETGLSTTRHEAAPVIERDQMRWLTRADEVDCFHVGDMDYTVDVDRTPTDGLITDDLREGSYPSAESEVAHA